MTTLYKRDRKGNLRFWSIEAEGTELVIEFGVEGGEIQTQIEHIEMNSFRDAEEQTISRMNSRIDKKKNKGYVDDKSLAMVKDNKNILGLPKPMLACRYDNLKEDVDLENSFFQYKYDGLRCLIANEDGKLIAYSRNGKTQFKIDHILEQIKIPEGTVLDGELYCHGISLQTINSLVKRLQYDTKKISYQCYDTILDENYDFRYEILHGFNFWSHNVNIVPTFTIQQQSITEMLDSAIKQGYEGLIIRAPGYDYEDGVRSKGLIKVKKFIDDEFDVIGIDESKDGWAILKCRMKNGNTFKVTTPGNIGFKTYVLKNRNQFIGKKVKVEYAKLTDDGIPFHPVAIMFRDKESE